MKRWHSYSKENKENKKVDAFVEDILAMYAKHGLSISHEDGNGSFLVEKDKEVNRLWLREASVEEEL